MIATSLGDGRRLLARVQWAWLYVTFVLLFLFTPVLVVTLFSFHSSSALSLPFEGFSLRWYREIVERPDIRHAALNSLVVAATTTAGTATLGTLAALGMPRLGRRAKEVVTNLAIAPIALPGIFLGISLLASFSLVEVRLSLATVVAAHMVFTLPVFLLIARARLDRFDVALEDAARDLGAGPVQTARYVTLPIIRPALIGAAFLVFALSFDEFIITLFIIGSEPTLPVLIWGQMRQAADPSINAISTLLLLLSLSGLAVASAFLRERRTGAARRRAREQRNHG